MNPRLYMQGLLLLPFFVLLSNCISNQTDNTDQNQEVSTANPELEQSKEIIVQRKVSTHDGSVPLKILEIVENYDQYFVEEISVLQDNDEVTIYTLINRDINSEDYVIWYNKAMKSVQNEIKLSDLNPYLQKGYKDKSYHQLDGMNRSVDLSVKNISDIIDINLFKGVVDEYYVSEINISQRAVATCSNCPIVLHFGLALLPGNEILENVPYPGVTTLIIYSPKGDERMSKKISLPFSVSEVVAPRDGETLLFTHQVPNHKFGGRLLDDDFWSQMCSIYSLKSREICFQSKEGYLFYVGYDSPNKTPYIQQYFDKEEWSIKEFVLFGNEILEYTYSTPDFRRVSEGVQLYVNNELIETLSYKNDFVKNKNSCNE